MPKMKISFPSTSITTTHHSGVVPILWLPFHINHPSANHTSKQRRNTWTSHQPIPHPVFHFSLHALLDNLEMTFQ
jgi:hypothetical protein